jgi:hypothetical protein
LVVCAAVVAVLAAGVAFGPKNPAKAQVVGSVTVADVSMNEGNAGGAKMVFGITTSGLVLSNETVHYKTVDGTAKAGDDYVAVEGDVQITKTGTQNVEVQLIGDTVAEPNETFTFQLSGGSSSNDNAVGTIVNDDFQVSVADLTVTEGDSGTSNAAVVISLDGGTRQAPTSVQYSTVNGTAVAPSDYTAANAVTATIPAGQPSVTVNIPIVGDALYEDDETFRVVLANPSTGVTIGDGDATVKITNNDPLPSPDQQPKISIADATINEGDSGQTGGTFAVTLSSQVPYTVTVKASSSDGTATAGTDYTAISNATITFAPGATTASLPTSVIGDAKDEFLETYTVTLSNASPGAVIDDGTATGAIVDDDPTPTLTVDDATGTEGGKATFTITLSTASGRDTVLAIGTNDATAKAGDDYTAVPNTTRLTIPAGTTSKTFDVALLSDSLDEPDETFKFGVAQASNPAATTFTDVQVATGTIKDATNDPALSIDDVSQDEGDSGTTTYDFTVTLAPASGQTVTVNYTVGPDVGAAAALPGVDFTPATGQLSFAPGETTKTITVAVAGDTTAEENETFKVSLSGAQHATLADGVGLGTITNDDGAFVRPGAITTGAGPGGDSHVRFFTADGTGVGGGFYATANGPGVRVARGDLDGDGHDEVIASSGRGGPSLVRVFTPDGSGLIAQIEAYPGFTGGVSIAAADLDGDGKDEIITGAGPGGGPHVRTFKLTGEPANRQLVGTAGFYGIDASNGYSGGVNVAGADLNADGKAEIITSVMGQIAPFVAEFSYNPATEQVRFIRTFLAFDQSFRGGVNLAAGDLDGDNKAEIVVGAGPGGAPHVRVLSAEGGGLPGSAYAYGASFPGGVQVAVGDIDGDGDNDIVTGVGPGGGPHVRGFDIDMNPLPTSFYAYGADFPGGVNVAVGKP